MPELGSRIASLAGAAVESVREVLIQDEDKAPVERPCLPSQDTDPVARAAALRDARGEAGDTDVDATNVTHWLWDHDYVPGMALLQEGDTKNTTLGDAATPWKHLPLAARPPVDYLPLRAASLTELAASMVRERFSEGLAADTGHLQSLDAYNALIRRPLKVPATCERWRDDLVFAWQRVAGANPLVIQRVDGVPHHMPISDEQLAGVWRDGLVLADELAAGNVYMADYTIMEEVGTTSDASGTRQVWPVVGLFHVDRSADPSAPLRPLAIQLGRDGGVQHTFTPQDGARWLVAKTALQCADITLHEMGTHLGRAHFALESVVVAAHRQLAHRHPVLVLLQPHFRIVLFNNFEGRELLVNKGGKVDQLMAGGVVEQLHLVMQSVDGFPEDTDGSPQTKHWSMENFDLPLDLAQRGVEDLPNYPYAEDGHEVWTAIHAFVSEYLAIYYDDDTSVAGDTELQAWLQEMRDPNLGKVRGVPDVSDRTSLARVLTRIIFASGPQHSAINFAQYECAVSAANMPLALYQPLPAELAEWSEERVEAFLLELLPPVEKAKAQISTIVELTSFHYDQLGHYKAGDFKDPLVAPVIERFQKRLAAIDSVVDARNSERLLPYPFLRPSNILNSTSI